MRETVQVEVLGGDSAAGSGVGPGLVVTYRALVDAATVLAAGRPLHITAAAEALLAAGIAELRG